MRKRDHFKEGNVVGYLEDVCPQFLQKEGALYLLIISLSLILFFIATKSLDPFKNS